VLGCEDRLRDDLHYVECGNGALNSLNKMFVKINMLLHYCKTVRI